MVIMLVNLNRLFVRHRDRVRRRNWDGHFDTHRNFNADRNVNGNGNLDGNLDGHLDGDVLDHWNLDRDGLRYSVGLGNRYGLRYGVWDSVRLWYGDRCGNWEWDAVAFAESLLKTLVAVVADFERGFGRLTRSL